MTLMFTISGQQYLTRRMSKCTTYPGRVLRRRMKTNKNLYSYRWNFDLYAKGHPSVKLSNVYNAYIKSVNIELESRQRFCHLICCEFILHVYSTPCTMICWEFKIITLVYSSLSWSNELGMVLTLPFNNKLKIDQQTCSVACIQHLWCDVLIVTLKTKPLSDWCIYDITWHHMTSVSLRLWQANEASRRIPACRTDLKYIGGLHT